MCVFILLFKKCYNDFQCGSSIQNLEFEKKCSLVASGNVNSDAESYVLMTKYESKHCSI